MSPCLLVISVRRISKGAVINQKGRKGNTPPASLLEETRLQAEESARSRVGRLSTEVERRKRPLVSNRDNGVRTLGSICSDHLVDMIAEIAPDIAVVVAQDHELQFPLGKLGRESPVTNA